MNNWLKKDLKIKIVSILLAIFFWLIVSNITNPFVTKTISNVPVTIENEDFLEQNGYTIKNTYRNYIDVTIRGRKDAVEKVKPADFVTVLDFAQIKSVHDRKLVLSEPVCLRKDVTIESYNPTAIDILLARNKTGTFPVKLKPNITLKPGYVLLGTYLSQETVQINGEENLIDSVDSIVAELELKDLDRDTTKQVQCKVYNKSGNEISTLSRGLKVTVKVEVAKEVPVSLVTRGRLAADYVETLRVIEPEKVLVRGSASVLEGISVIKTEQLDIDGLKGNLTATVPLVVPEGVKLVNSPEQIIANISVEKLAVRSMQISRNDISILNAKNDGSLVYEIVTDNLQLQFKGRQAEVDAITVDKLKPAVDVSGLAEGTHKLQLNLNVPPQVRLLQKMNVEVKIAKTPETNSNSNEIDRGNATTP